MTARAAIGAVLIQSLACYSWREVPVQDAPAPAMSSARITLLSGSTIDASGVTIARDTVRGMSGLISRHDFAIPRDSVRAISERKVDWGRTGGLAAIIVALAFWSKDAKGSGGP